MIDKKIANEIKIGLERKAEKWVERKNYTHFDLRSSLKDNWKYITCPNNVSAHAFLPLIKFNDLIERYEKNNNKRIVAYKARPICYTSHKDRSIYKFYAGVLNHYYNKLIKEIQVDDAVIAYRTDQDGKCNIIFAKEAFDCIKSFKSCHVLVGDFKKFFDRLEHTHLENKIKETLGIERSEKLPKDWIAVFNSTAQYSYVELGALTYLALLNADLSILETEPEVATIIKNAKKEVGKHFEESVKNEKDKETAYGRIREFGCDFVDEQDKTQANFGKCLGRTLQMWFADSNKHTGYGKSSIDMSVLRKFKKEYGINLIKRGRTQEGGKFIGIPQGTPISAVLANIYMIDFDAQVNKLVKSKGGKYMRYSDDFIIILPNAEGVCINGFFEEIKQKIGEVPFLKLADNKTHAFLYDKGSDIKMVDKTSEFRMLEDGEKNKNKLDYLGFSFDGEFVRIKEATISRHYRKAISKANTINRQRKEIQKAIADKKPKLKGGGSINFIKTYTAFGLKYDEEGNGNFLSYVARACEIFKGEPKLEEFYRKHDAKMMRKLTSR